MIKEISGGRYGVDDSGAVYSLRNNAGNRRHIPKAIVQVLTREGYLTCGIREDTSTGVIRRTLYVHRLVAIAYIPNPDDKPEVNHKDGIKGNNSPNNLEWVTTSENAKHAFACGLRVVNRPAFKGKFNSDHPGSRPIRQLTMDGVLVREYPSAHEAKRHGFSQANISTVIAGKREHHKGFRWEFFH